MFDSLMSGMSWDQAQESYREQKDQVPQKEPTEKEILADWIISKDQQ